MCRPKEQFDPSQYEEAFKAASDLHLELGHEKEMPDGTDIHTKVDFSSPFWTKLMGLTVLGVVLYRINDYYFSHEAVHPLVKFVKSFGEDPTVAEAEDVRWKAVYARQAQDNLILKDFAYQEKPIHRLRCPDLIHRASDWSIVPGTQVNVSDIQFKHDWQEDDKYFGVPFPKKE